MKHGSHAGMKMPDAPDKFFSFDITNLTGTLLKNKLLNARPTLTIIPAGEPLERSNPLIGEISVAEQ